MAGLPPSDPRAVLQAQLQLARYELVMAESKVKTLEHLVVIAEANAAGGQGRSNSLGMHQHAQHAAAHQAQLEAWQQQQAVVQQAQAAAAVAAQLQERQQQLQRATQQQQQQQQMAGGTGGSGMASPALGAATAPPTPAATAAAEGLTSPAAAKKKRKRVLLDAEGNIVKPAKSGYQTYMAEMMKQEGKDGAKPVFGDVASKWKDLSDAEKGVWTQKAKDAAPKAVGHKWIEIEDEVDSHGEPKKKKPRKKREKSGYNLYVSSIMKDDKEKKISDAGIMWKELSDKERQVWNDKASKDANVVELVSDDDAAAAAVDDEEDKNKKPAAKKKAPAAKKAAASKKKQEDDDEAPAAASKKKAPTPKKKKKEEPKKKEAPAAKKKAAPKKAKEESAGKKKAASKKEEESTDEDDVPITKLSSPPQRRRSKRDKQPKKIED